MKSLYESIKSIMEMGGGGGQAQKSTAEKDAQDQARSSMSGSAQSWRNYSRGKENTLPKTVTKDKWNSKHDVSQTAPVAVRDNGVKPGNEKTPDSGIKPVKDTNLASQVGKPKTDRQTVQALGKKPAAVAAVKDQGQKDREAAADAANKVNQAAVAKQKDNEADKAPEEPKDRFSATSVEKPEAPEESGRAARALATPSKRASILPPDTMQKNLDKAKSNLDNMMTDKSDDEDSGSSAKAMASYSKSKSEDEPKPQASETPAPKAKEDGNTKTDADGRTYVRQKGVMGQPDTWNRSYASAGDFLNKIKGKGDINGKETTKESYVNKTFGVSNDLTASIMEVLKKKESSAPRNDKEQDLAAQYGDPKRITHGDVLVARGVIKPKKLKEWSLPKVKLEIVQAKDMSDEDRKKVGMERLNKPSSPSKDSTEPNTPPKDSGKPNRPQAYDGGKPNKPNIKESVGRRLALNALSRMVEGATSGPELDARYDKDKKDWENKGKAWQGSTPAWKKKDFDETPAGKAYSYLKNQDKQDKANSNKPTNEASDYTLDPKLKSPNSDEFHNRKQVAPVAAYDDDVKGQQKYKSRTSGGVWNKIKDKLGVDKPDENYGPKKESRDTPGNSYEHQCAIHVKSESFGEGRTVTTQHADPDHDGYIAWYDVMFEHGIEKYVPTAELEILVSETHMHSKRKKAMNEAAPEEDEYAPESAKAKRKAAADMGAGADKPAAAPATAPAGQAAMSYAPASSKQAEPAPAPAASGPKTNALGIAAQANVPGASALTSGKPAPAASGPSTNALGVQAQANVKGADALTGGASTPKPDTAQAAATPKPAQSDAMSAIDGGSIGTSQMSYSKAPADAKQGIAANAPAARVVSTSDGAKEAGYTQPNQRIAGFKSNARAREQAAGAAGVEAPLPGGNGKTIAQARQELGGKPVPGTPSAAAQNKPQASAAAAPAGQSARSADMDRRIADLRAKAQGAGIAPDRAQFTAGMKPGETRTATGSFNTATGEKSFNQSSSVQPPAGESPEEKARKLAAQKKPAGSYQGQGMVGNDF